MHKVSKIIYPFVEGHLDMINKCISDFCKIIATTDPKLRNSKYTKEELGGTTPKIYGLPQIPQSFIEEYCKVGGIDKVLVEYMNGYINNRPVSNGVLKTDSNNCIIIHPVEEKMYSMEFIKWYSGMEEQKILNAHKRWIKENL